MSDKKTIRSGLNMCRVGTGVAAVLLATSPVAVHAQTEIEAPDRVLGCKPPSNDTDRFVLDMMKSSRATSWMVQANNHVCRSYERIVNVFDRKDPDLVRHWDVIDEATPEVDPVLAAMERKRELNELEAKLKRREEGERDRRRMTNPVDEAMRELNEREEAERIGTLPTYGADPIAYAEAMAAREELRSQIYLLPEKKGGFIAIFQGKEGAIDPKAPPPESLEQLDGEGTLITSEGIAVGTFDNGTLDGEGEEILNDGTWRIGRYDGGRMNGYGIVIGEGENEQQIYMTGGMFRDDLPDGTFETTYADGTSRLEIWEGGKMVAAGDLAGPGSMPNKPNYKSPTQLAAEAEEKFAYKLDNEKNVGALFALADELDSSGQNDKARQAFRALIRRFPDSPLAATAAQRLSGGGGSPDTKSAQQSASASQSSTTRSSGRSAQYSSICMRNLNKLQERASTQNKSFQFTYGFYDALISMAAPCQAYDPEAAQEVRIKQNERNGLNPSTDPDPDLPWLQAEARRANSDVSYSADLGPYRLGPGGVGGGTSRTESPPPSRASSTGGTYQTQLSNPILPPSIIGRFTGRGLPVATCSAQMNQNVALIQVDPNGGMLVQYRTTLAAAELGLAIFRQCEGDAAAEKELAYYRSLYTTSLENCRKVASSEGACLAPWRP